MAPAPGSTVQVPPIFTLYADGRAIYVDYVVTERRGTVVSIQHAQLSEGQASELVEFALGVGGLAEAQPNYPSAPVTDAENTIFEVHGGGTDKRVVAYALGYDDDGDPDEAIRTKLEFLANRLDNFSADIANGGGEDLGAYEPESYRVILEPVPALYGDVSDELAWPWPSLQPSDFLAQPNHARQMSLADLLPVVDTPLAPPDNLVVSGSDETSYFVRIRALLPDEVVPTT